MGDVNILMSDVGLKPNGPTSDPSSLLFGTLSIGGTPCYLEAIAVTENAQGEQTGVNQKAEDRLTDVYRLVEPDSPFETVLHEGRDYVVYVTPACR